MKKILILLSISIFLISCSTEDITGNYVITSVNEQTLDQGGLKSLTILVQQFKDGQIDIAYYAIDTEHNDYSQNWENVKVDKKGNITKTLSNSELYYITGNFSKNKCDLKILENTTSESYHIIGEKQK